MPTPSADGMPRRTTMAAAQAREAWVFHLVEMEDAIHADDQGEDTGQQALSQGAIVVCETLLGRGQPTQGLGHQEERARVLGPHREKGGGDAVTDGMTSSGRVAAPARVVSSPLA